MDKWEKVVLLHRTLKSFKYCIPLKTIMAELECSEATFHRIRGFMQSRLGAPIVFNRAYGGYCYDTSQTGPFELPGLWFTRNEIEALLSLEYAVETMQGGFFREILAPVKTRFEPVLKAQKTRMATLRERIKIIPIQSRPINESIFRVVAGAVVWKQGSGMIVGAVLGGYLGAHYAQKLPGSWIRGFVIAVGTAMTAYFFWKGYH